MSTIAVVGAGHAGVEAAFTLAAAGHAVTLFSNENCLPYFRPRLIAVAFGQTAPDAIRIKPVEAYEKAGITLRHAPVTELGTEARTVNGETFDGIILSQGSRPFVPPFAGTGVADIHTLWTLADALKLREAATPGKRLTVIGGGVLGLEAALRAAMSGMKVTVVERLPALLNGILGSNGEAVLRHTLETKGITLVTGKNILTVDTDAIRLENAPAVPHDLVLCSAGARPMVTLAEAAGYTTDAGLLTRPTLAVAPRIYAAGDLARPTERRPVCAVRRASAMGKLAAQNLSAELTGNGGSEWTDSTLPLFMKVEDVEFHTLGDCFSPDTEEVREDDGSNPLVWKSTLRRNDTIVGFRLVGTRAGYGDFEKMLNK